LDTSTGLAWLLMIVVVLAVWLAAGALRAETKARDHFAAAHGEGATVADVHAEASGPTDPPFWSVTINRHVTEPPRSCGSSQSPAG
jgi:hypothetical protein